MGRGRIIGVRLALVLLLHGAAALPCPSARAETADATALRAEAARAQAVAQAADAAVTVAEAALQEARRAWDRAAAEALRVTRAARAEAHREGQRLPVLRPPKDPVAFWGALKAAEDEARQVEQRARRRAVEQVKGLPPEAPRRDRRPTVHIIEDPFADDHIPPPATPELTEIIFQPAPGEYAVRRAARASAMAATKALVAAEAALERRRTEAGAARKAARQAADAADWADVEALSRSAAPGVAVTAIEAYLDSHREAPRDTPRARLRELGALPDLRPLAAIFAPEEPDLATRTAPRAAPSTSDRQSADDPAAPDHLDALARETLAWTAVAFERTGPAREPALRHALALASRYDDARPLHPAAADVLNARIRLESALGNGRRVIPFTARLVRDFPQSVHARARLYEALSALLAAGDDAPAAELAQLSVSRRVVETRLDRARALLVLGYTRWSVDGRSDRVRQDLEAALRALGLTDARRGRESAQVEAVAALARQGLERLDALR